MRDGRIAGEACRHRQRRPAEPAERPGVLHARRHRHREQRDQDAVRAEHQADEALAQPAVDGEERRGEHHQAHAERKDEREGGKGEEHLVAEHGKRFAVERLFSRAFFRGQSAAQAEGVEPGSDQVARGAQRGEQAVALLGDVARRRDGQRVGDADHGVVERQHRLAAAGLGQVEQQRRAHRHGYRAGHAHGDAPREQAGRAVHQEERGQHGGVGERRAQQQRLAADAVAERAEHRREQAAQQVLAQEREPDGGERDAGLAHEPDAEEGHQAHARGDREEVGREDDLDAAAQRPQ